MPSGIEARVTLHRGVFGAIAAVSIAGILEIFGSGHTMETGSFKVSVALGFFVASLPLAIACFGSAREVGGIHYWVRIITPAFFGTGLFLLVEAMCRPVVWVFLASTAVSVIVVSTPTTRKATGAEETSPRSIVVDGSTRRAG